jgi:hypothetical protein
MAHEGEPMTEATRDGAQSSDWMAHANCRRREHRHVDFFAFDRASVSEALSICDHCAVLDECLAYATRERLSGIWGGTTEAERTRPPRPRRVHIAVDEPPAATGAPPDREVVSRTA